MAKKSAKKEEPIYFSTGCTLLDLVVGGGIGMGFPAGAFVNLIGDSSSGKTLISLEMLAANVHKYGKKFKHNHDDAESGCTFDTEGLYGFESHPEGNRVSGTVEEMDANVGSWLKSLKEDQKGIYIVDSLDGLSSVVKEKRAVERIKLLEKGKEVVDDGTYGAEVPKFLSQEFFKSRTPEIEAKDAICVIISQTRDDLKPGLFKKAQRSGGRALKFYCHTELWLATIRKIKKKDRIVGVVIEAKTGKNRTPRPFRNCRFSVFFDYGVDNIGSNLDFLFDLRGKDGDLVKAAQAVQWGGKEKSLRNLRTFLKEAGEYENARKARKKEVGKSGLELEWLLEWLNGQAHLQKGLSETFPEVPTLSRDEWIAKIEGDAALEKELEQAVIDKWEAIEESIKSHRKRKYS